MKTVSDKPKHRQLFFPCLWGFTLILLFTGLLLDSPSHILCGLHTIIFTEDALITDYVLVAGAGAALVNSALVTAISILFLQHCKEAPNGLTLVVIGLMSGFSLFGKNFVNIWPFLIGTRLYAAMRHESFGKYLPTSLMSTALAPIVSYFVLDNGGAALPIGILTGMLIGFIMPALSAYTYKVQNGMNLYNVGFASGLLAFLIVPVISSFSASPTTRYHWATDSDRIFAALLGSLCLLLIISGLFCCRRSPKRVWLSYRALLRTSGRAPSDYLRMFGPAPVLVNIGINGLIGLAFIILSGGNLNGPTAGGILTIMGFSAFGKHAKNILPIMGGVVLGSMMMQWSLADGAVQLAGLFCTTLAPIAGYFGWSFGVLAGFLHSAVVLHTSSPVAGMNLYNNGFSGGLVAIVLYALLIAIVQHRRPEIQNEDYFDIVENDNPSVPRTAFHMTEQVDQPDDAP